MATTVALLEAKLLADTRDFDQAMGKSDSRMKSVAKTMGKAGLAGAAIGLGAAVKVGFDEFMEAQKVAAQTEAVIKSTGGTANVTAKEVGNLATALMRKSGVDDEAIASGENMLLTFTKIRNETGRGNDVFNQATKATLDLSVAMGKDMQSSAILVGKALNDPIKGMSALGRAGIQFTAEQKETIQTLVDSGRTMDAQKMILKELETQFGGSAEAAGKTFSGQLNIAKETMRNLAGSGVAFLMPHLQSFTGWIRDTAVPFIRNFVDGLKGNEGALGAFTIVKAYVVDVFLPAIRGILGVFRDAFTAVGRVLNDHRDQVRTIVEGVKAILTGISLVFQEVILPALRFVFKEGGPFDIAFGLAIGIVAGLVRVIEGIAVAVRETIQAVLKFWNGKGGDIIREVFGAFADAIEPVVKLFEEIIDAVKWLIDNVGKLGGIIGKIPGVGGTGPFAGGEFIPPGPVGPGSGGGGHFASLTPGLHDEAALAQATFASQIQSYNPASRLPSGAPSDHAVYPAKAFDAMFSPAIGMNHPGARAFFNAMIGRPGIHYAILGDKIWSTTGGLHPYGYGGHENHVHVSAADTGRLSLMPGWNMTYNGTGARENLSTGGGIVINVAGSVVSENDLVEAIARGLERRGQRNVDIFGGAR